MFLKAIISIATRWHHHQVLVVAIPCGFKSLHPHHKKALAYASAFSIYILKHIIIQSILKAVVKVN